MMQRVHAAQRRTLVSKAGRAAVTLAMFGTWAASGPSEAQSGTPLRMIVGFPAGGNVDWVARLVAEKIRTPINRTVLVENRPGAGSRIALNELRRAPADGNNVAMTVDAPFTMYPFTVARLEYEAPKDFSPIVRVATFDYAIAISPTHPARNLREFAQWASKNPSQASFASPGSGTGPSFLGSVIGKTFNVKLNDVPYKGGAAANTDVIGGAIAASIGVLPDMVELHRAGRLRVIAIGGAKRSPLLPEVQTLRESGVDFDGDISISLYGPSGLAPAFVKELSRAVSDSLAVAETREQFLNRGLTPASLTPEQLALAEANERQKWEAIIKASNFEPQ